MYPSKQSIITYSVCQQQVEAELQQLCWCVKVLMLANVSTAVKVRDDLSPHKIQGHF